MNESIGRHVYLRICSSATSCILANIGTWRRLLLLRSRSMRRTSCTGCSLNTQNPPHTPTQSLNEHTGRLGESLEACGLFDKDVIVCLC